MPTAVASPESPAFSPANMPKRKGETITPGGKPIFKPGLMTESIDSNAVDASESFVDDPEITSEREAALQLQLDAANKEILELKTTQNEKILALEARIDAMTKTQDSVGVDVEPVVDIAPEAKTTNEQETEKQGRLKKFGRGVLNAVKTATESVKEKFGAAKIKVTDMGSAAKAQTIKVTAATKQGAQNLQENSSSILKKGVESARSFATGGDALQNTIDDINQREAEERGEISWDEYLAQRPKDGVIRGENGEFYNTATEEAASREEYDAQNGNNTQDYYYQVGGVEGITTDQPVEKDAKYSARKLDTLLENAQVAKEIGDQATFEQIRHAMYQRMMKAEGEDRENAKAVYRELLGVEQKEIVDDEVEQPEQKAEKSRIEKLKAFFAKEGKKLQEFGGAAYFGEQFRRAMSGARSFLNKEVTDGMSQEQAESIRKRNRRLKMLGEGAAIVGGLAIAGLSINGSGMLEGSTDVASTLDLNALDNQGGFEARGFNPFDAAPSLDVTPDTSALIPDQVPVDTSTEVPGDSSIRWSEDDIATASTEYNIESGQGGISLFGQLGLSEDAWYSHAAELAQKFPSDFYMDATGEVGINYNGGQLSQGAREYIEALR